MIKNYIQRLSQDGLAIFLFHGVVVKSEYQIRNYMHKHLEKRFFASLLKALKAHGHPLSMDEIVYSYQEKIPFPPNAFAITLDDGFENNYSVAAPILKDLNLPAVFYITTEWVDENGMAWADKAEYCLEKTRRGRVSFPWEGVERGFESASEKIQLMRMMRDHIKFDRSIDTDEFISELFKQCGIEEIQSSDDPLDKKLNWDQVRQLAGDALFTVGGHSHQHTILTFLCADNLDKDIKTCLTFLEEKADVKTHHFSYPEGVGHCYSDGVAGVLKQHGIVCCPTAEDGLNTESTDLFHLKRIAVPSGVVIKSQD